MPKVERGIVPNPPMGLGPTIPSVGVAQVGAHNHCHGKRTFFTQNL